MACIIHQLVCHGFFLAPHHMSHAITSVGTRYVSWSSVTQLSLCRQSSAIIWCPVHPIHQSFITTRLCYNSCLRLPVCQRGQQQLYQSMPCIIHQLVCHGFFLLQSHVSCHHFGRHRLCLMVFCHSVIIVVGRAALSDGAHHPIHQSFITNHLCYNLCLRLPVCQRGQQQLYQSMACIIHQLVFTAFFSLHITCLMPSLRSAHDMSLGLLSLSYHCGRQSSAISWCPVHPLHQSHHESSLLHMP